MIRSLSVADAPSDGPVLRSSGRASRRLDATGTTTGAAVDGARRALLEGFVRGLGYPEASVETVVTRFRRERGAMTAAAAGLRLTEWISDVRGSEPDGSDRSLDVADAVTVFIVSGAAMWRIDELLAPPSELPPRHRAALAGRRSLVLPAERPLSMPPQNLDGPRWGRRRPVEPTRRRVSWVPSR